ncbi:response regulator transcription factor [Clostridium pasteurianum]|uniref:response regulator transcription factor n=1 Tax=Clostridium pasteurianum TaxID=1501 RepID=UPI0003A49AA2|nr:response regulator transcription factor [Clostridium pasteurianum]
MEEVEEISTTIIMDHNEEFLTNKETEVMLEISKGLSNKEIAEKLCISLATVKTHIINIYSKLQVNSRVAAVEKARKMDIIKN